MTPQIKRGYCHLNLNNKCFRIHRLVAEAFIENPNNLEDVNHKNGIKTDNRVENLEWLSHTDNMRHATDVLHNMGREIIQYTKEGEYIATWKNAFDFCKEKKLSESNIYKVCNGKRKTAYGYCWKYKI